MNKAPSVASADKVGCTTKTERFLALCCNAIFIKAFVLTFVAEWGDRSQLSTVTLAVSTVKNLLFFQIKANLYSRTLLLCFLADQLATLFAPLRQLYLAL